MHYPDGPAGSREPDRNRPEGVVSAACPGGQGRAGPAGTVSLATSVSPSQQSR